MSTDLERTQPREVSVTDSSYMERWSDRQKALILRTVAKDATPEELHLFLAQAAQHNLNPLTGEIWCIKTRGRNGQEGRLAIIVGEQGRLKIANRFPDYLGYRSDVICENDRFMRLAEPKEVVGAEGCWTYVEHSYGHPKERGAIVGAWCEVHREGRPATFFYAPLEEYLPQDPSDREKAHSPWFSTRSRMIVKCADSTAFRMAFNLSGVYGEEEMEHLRQAEGGRAEQEIEWGRTDEEGEWFRSLAAVANDLVPGAYLDAKLVVLLNGSDDEQREKVEQELVSFIEGHGGTVPVRGEEVVGRADTEVMDEEMDPEAAGIPFGDQGDGGSEEPLPGV